MVLASWVSLPYAAGGAELDKELALTSTMRTQYGGQ